MPESDTIARLAQLLELLSDVPAERTQLLKRMEGLYPDDAGNARRGFERDMATLGQLGFDVQKTAGAPPLYALLGHRRIAKPDPDAWNPATHKRCEKCREVLPRSRFQVVPQSFDGYSYTCQRCLAQAARYRARLRAALPPGHKVCSKCRKILPVESFATDNARRDKRMIYCRACNAVLNKEVRSRIPPREQVPHEKQCKTCGEVLPIAAFGVARDRRDGHKASCMPCMQAYDQAAYRQRRNHQT